MDVSVLVQFAGLDLAADLHLASAGDRRGLGAGAAEPGEAAPDARHDAHVEEVGPGGCAEAGGVAPPGPQLPPPRLPDVELDRAGGGGPLLAGAGLLAARAARGAATSRVLEVRVDMAGQCHLRHTRRQWRTHRRKKLQWKNR